MSIRIWILGEPALADADGRPVRLVSRRAWALLALLVQSQGRTLERGDVAEMLWPNRGSDQARASLRQELAVLRKALRGAGVDPVEATKDSLRFTGDAFSADSTALEHLVEAGGRAERRSAAQLCRGPLLEGLAVKASAFQDWLEGERARVARILARTMAEHLREEAADGPTPAAVSAARALLTADPAAEAAHRTLMMAEAQAGRPQEALRQYERCRAALREAGKGAPGPEVEALAADLRAGRTAPPPPAPPADQAAQSLPAAPDEPPIARQAPTRHPAPSSSPAPPPEAPAAATPQARADGAAPPPPQSGPGNSASDAPAIDAEPPEPAPPAPSRADRGPDPAAAGEGPTANAVVLVAHLPQLAGLPANFDTAAAMRAQGRFAEAVRRIMAETGGTYLPGKADRAVAVFDANEPGAAARAAQSALMLAAEPVALEGAGHVAPACGLAIGPVAWRDEDKALAGVALQVAGRAAAMARPGQALTDASVSNVNGTEIHLVPSDIVGLWALRPAPGKAAAAKESPDGPGIAALWRDWAAALLRADMRVALALAEQAAARAGTDGQIGQVMTGAVRLLRGQLDTAQEALQSAERLQTDPEPFGLDPGAAARGMLALERCLAGDPDEAHAGLDRLAEEVRALDHAPTALFVHAVAMLIHDELGGTRGALNSARAMFHAAKGQPAWRALAAAALGRGHDRMGEPTGADEIAEGLRAYRAHGGVLAVPLVQAWLAAARLETDALSEGLVLVDEALAQGAATGVLLAEPELLRLQAVLTARQGHARPGQMEAAYVTALQAGRRAGAALHELRTSVSFAAHLRALGRLRDAKAHLDRGISAVAAATPPAADMVSAIALRRRLELD